MISEVAPGSARERLLAAADKLFYEEGVNTVGIDRVIEAAGVAKATLYSTFGSKEGLIIAYLRARLEGRQERTMSFLAEARTPRERVLTQFDVLDSFVREPGFNGCAFMNANAEAQPGSAVQQAAHESRMWTFRLFTDLARDVGAHDPEALARQLVLLYDGALVSSRMDNDLDAALSAKASAETLVDAATRRRRPAAR